MRVLIAPDKFKGSLTAAEVADHLAKGLAEAGAHARTLPLAGGGDGSVAAALASGFHPLPVDVGGATGENHRGVVAFDLDTAIVEVANTCGLATLPGRVRAPMTASSYGFGEAIRVALTLSRPRLVLALGGSATTDGGIGMLAALGYRFLDNRPVSVAGGLMQHKCCCQGCRPLRARDSVADDHPTAPRSSPLCVRAVHVAIGVRDLAARRPVGLGLAAAVEGWPVWPSALRIFLPLALRFRGSVWQLRSYRRVRDLDNSVWPLGQRLGG